MKFKRVITIVLLTILILFTQSFRTDAGTVVIKKSNGTDLTYRNSSEKVLRMDAYPYPTSDFRAVWISSYVGDVASYVSVNQYKTEINSILDTMELYGLNAMIFHIRIHNDALYDSDLNPIRSYWSSVNFDSWDPLTYIIEESHKRGIEFHAWLNPYRIISSDYVGSLADYAQSFRNSNPELLNNPAGDASMLLKGTNNGIILNPGEPIVRNHIYDTIQEIIDKYDVDAIHFDDYFYNSISDTQDNITYQKAGYNPKGLSKDNWRRDQVNLLMAGIKNLLLNHFDKTEKVVQLGISPTGIYQNAPAGTAGQEHYSALFCDSVAWIQNEWIDYLLPQTYWGFEHSVAGFAQLTRYWNNVVKGYEVNMYMGHGIYMAPGSGWEHIDEIKNRLLNMAMYDRIDGSSFYKYGTFKNLNSASEIVRQGFNLLKDDYWAKKVPGTVVRSFANLVPSLEVTNINVQNFGTQMTLSWQAIDNVRGYIVYQVPKSQALNQKNINHLYQYIQTNQITVNNIDFDYYLSSVNLANVVSTPVLVDTNSYQGYQGVINGINNLPTNISLNDELTITKIRQAFNELSPVEQSEVTNIHVLINAEKVINKLKDLRTIVQEVIARTNKHVKANYLFPTSTLANISWSYKSGSNHVFDLENGIRLKDKLLPTLETLIIKGEKDNLVYEEEVVINFGILATNQIGNFYRNSASALSKDEEGPYVTTSHIGWDNKTLTFGNQVLFIAKGNYFSITNAFLDVPNWSSCGVVYHNETLNDITFLAGNSAIRTDVNLYGYIIIGQDNKVKEVVMDVNANTAITLKSKEILYAPNYLESQMTNSTFVPSSKILIGSSAFLTDYQEEAISSQDRANQVIALIDRLTVAEQMTIYTDTIPYLIARANYEALDDEAKALVTNLDKLIACENRLQELEIEGLEIMRNLAYSKLLQYENNLSNYSSSNQILLMEIVNQVRQSLEIADTIDEINTIMVDGLSALNQVLTIEDEALRALLIKQNEAKEELQHYIDLNHYSAVNQTKIRNYLSDAFEQLDNAKLNEIEAIVINTKLLIDNIKTIIEEEIILLNNAKTYAKSLLNSYVNLNDYSLANQTLVQTIINNGLLAIDASLTTTEVQTALGDAKVLINDVKTLEEEAIEALNGQKELAKNELEAYPNLNDYSEDNQIAVKQLINTGKVALDNAKSQAEINDILFGFKAEIDAVPMLEKGLDDLKEAKVQALTNYVNLSKYSVSNQAKINRIINNGKSSIEAGKSVEEVNQAFNHATALIDEIAPLAPQGFNCNNISTYFISMIVVLSLAIALIRRKE